MGESKLVDLKHEKLSHDRLHDLFNKYIQADANKIISLKAIYPETCVDEAGPYYNLVVQYEGNYDVEEI